jgi:hypothetical protein
MLLLFWLQLLEAVEVLCGVALVVARGCEVELGWA